MPTTAAVARCHLGRRLAAEAIGTALLLAGVVGSGIMAERLSGGSEALALLANTIATGAILVALILALGHVSAHLNPAVTLTEITRRTLRPREALAYVAVQLAAAPAGVALAHLMFGEPVFLVARHPRAGAGIVLGEVVATLGLVLVIRGCGRARPDALPFAVGAWITAGYWFTASTSFANPAVTLARALTDTFTGIRPTDAPAFIGAQLAGAAAGVLLDRLLRPAASPVATHSPEHRTPTRAR
jgi:glycerol uptake facilitator-like aquaporin